LPSCTYGINGVANPSNLELLAGAFAFFRVEREIARRLAITIGESPLLMKQINGWLIHASPELILTNLRVCQNNETAPDNRYTMVRNLILEVHIDV
jgi:hypothetical protein